MMIRFRNIYWCARAIRSSDVARAVEVTKTLVGSFAVPGRKLVREGFLRKDEMTHMYVHTYVRN